MPIWPFKKRASAETFGHPAQKDKNLARLFGLNGESRAGVDVTNESLLQVEAVFACVRLLAQTVSSLPLYMYERTEEGNKERRDDHPLANLLRVAPNPRMTSFEFREVGQSALETRGEFFAEIVRNVAAEPVELWPLPNRVVEVRSDGWDTRYFVQSKFGEVEVPRENMFHLKFLVGSDGVTGTDPLTYMRESVALTQATRDFGSSFFGNGTHMGGALRHPGKLTDVGFDNLRKSINSYHQGTDQAHRFIILEEDMDWTPFGVDPENAQFLETRKFQTAEIARIFGVPPHMIGDLERATFSNIEEQGINFVVHSIRPRLVRWEQALNRALLTEEQRKRYFFEFNVDGLLRGNIQARYAAYQTGILAGFINRNEVRSWENLNRVDGLDEFLTQPGMQSGSGEQTIDPEEEQAGDGEDRGVEILAEHMAHEAEYEKAD